MNDGTKDPDPLAPADAEETHAANALREALEGRPGGVEAPESPLEAAALLRAGGPAARLADARRAALRTELLASLPKGGGAPRTARAGLSRWFTLFLPLAGGAAAAVALGIFATRSSDPLAALDDAARSQSTAPAGQALRGPAASPAPESVSALSAAKDSAGSLSASSGANDRAADARGVAAGAQMARRVATSAHSPGVVGTPAAPAARSLDLASEAEQGSGALAHRVANEAAPTERARADELGGGAALGPVASLAAPGAGAGSRPPADTAKRLASAAPKASAQPLEERLRRETLRYRSVLLPRLADGRVDAAYTDLDRAQSGEQLRIVQTKLTALSTGALGNGANAADTDLVRQDIFCRLAEVALRLGQPQAALEWTRQGLELPASPNPFAARLHQLAGQAHEALGDREGAARSYSRAIEINEKLLDESLDAP
jgi:tetratricopeptide (TPR) repeat protein